MSPGFRAVFRMMRATTSAVKPGSHESVMIVTMLVLRMSPSGQVVDSLAERQFFLKYAHNFPTLGFGKDCQILNAGTREAVKA